LLSHPSLRMVPMILETPKKTPGDDVRNLSQVRRLFRTLSSRPARAANH
jgi:hypothetical protein